MKRQPWWNEDLMPLVIVCAVIAFAVTLFGIALDEADDPPSLPPVTHATPVVLDTKKLTGE